MRNGYAIAGLSLGIASILLTQLSAGSLPILAIVFSAIGLSKADEYDGRGTIQSWFGLVLGIIYLIATLVPLLT